jgi:hypothetical protein
MADAIEFLRDRALGEIKDASSTVSQNARAIGIGLALVLYTLVFDSDEHGWLVQYRTPLFIAAICGIACLALDYLQYHCMIWQNRVVLSTLAAEKQRIIELAETEPARAEAQAERLLNATDTVGDAAKSAYLREFCFHAKFVVMLVGVGAMVLITFEALMFPSRPPSSNATTTVSSPTAPAAPAASPAKPASTTPAR